MRPAVWLLMLAGLLAVGIANAGGVLHIGNGNEPETLDPQRAEGVSAANIVRDLYEGLTGLSPSGEVQPAAAESWTVSADGLHYRFQLRSGLKWSDGSPLTAEDFVAGLRRSVDPATGSAYAQMLAVIDRAAAISSGHAKPETLAVTAVDAQTLSVHLRAPTPYLPGLMSHPSTFPIHRPSLQRWGRDFARPGRLVSNGAYHLKNWTPQSAVQLLRNRHYWRAASTAVDEVYFHATEDLGAELNRYRAGEFDITGAIPLLRARALREQLGSQLHVAPYLGTYYYGYNLERAPFKDNPKLRTALSMALDRELIVDKLMHGLALPAYGFVPPGTANYTPQQPLWARWPRERRLAEARKLYAEAGYSAARPLELELRYNTHDDHRRLAVVMAAMWKQWLGVRSRLVNEEFKVFIQNRRARKLTQLARQSWISDYDDASSFLDILQSGNGQNDSGYASAEYDALLARAAQEPDAGRRRQLLQAAEQLLLADWPVLPLYFYVSKHLVKPWVAGWQDNAQDYHYTKDLRVLPH